MMGQEEQEMGCFGEDLPLKSGNRESMDYRDQNKTGEPDHKITTAKKS